MRKLNNDSSPQKNKHKITIEPKTIMKVCVVSILVGHTTFLISTLDSFMSLIAFDPKLVIDISPSPIPNNNIAIFQLERWKYVRATLMEKAKKFDLTEDFIEQLFSSIHKESIHQQSKQMHD